MNIHYEKYKEMKIRKIVLIGLMILQSSFIYSQINKDVSIELRYPIPLGNNFLNNGFDGVGYIGLFDIGLDYNLFKAKHVGIGILLNTSLLRFNVSDLTLMVVSPKIKLDFFLNLGRFTLVPQLAVGYSRLRFRAPERTYYDEFGNFLYGGKFKNNENGISFKGATKLEYKINNKYNLYFQGAYEFTRLEKPKVPAVDNRSNRNIQILYPVIGMTLKF